MLDHNHYQSVILNRQWINQEVTTQLLERLPSMLLDSRLNAPSLVQAFRCLKMPRKWPWVLLTKRWLIWLQIPALAGKLSDAFSYSQWRSIMLVQQAQIMIFFTQPWSHSIWYSYCILIVQSYCSICLRFIRTSSRIHLKPIPVHSVGVSSHNIHFSSSSKWVWPIMFV